MKTAIYKCANCGTTMRTTVENGNVLRSFCYCAKDLSEFKRVKGTTEDSVIPVYIGSIKRKFYVDTAEKERKIRKQNPMFFKNVFRKTRETISFHRGCVIVRNTVSFTWMSPVRKTTIYLYGHFNGGEKDFFCVTPKSIKLSSVRQAKRYIDGILKNRETD